jgi:L-histidine Nalpha-methyltransferase
MTGPIRTNKLPTPSTVADDVRRGLTARPKTIEPKYFYDSLGSALFVAICELPEYYVTRAEVEILERHADQIARKFGSLERLVELGSGNARKTQRLIDAVLSQQPRLVYRPIDVDPAMLAASARELTTRFPALTVDALCADYFDVVSLGRTAGRTAVLFLGSSIGNLDHDDASALLRDVRRILRAGDAVFVGFDLKKDTALIEAAYDDALGVTAAFNRNVLVRLNRELDADFRLDCFTHRAYFNEAESRIEMHLVSTIRQTVHIEALHLDIEFEAGETIHTENSYKYDAASIAAVASAAGLTVEQQWTDARGWFADVLMRA